MGEHYLIVAAIVPALILMFYIYRKDKLEREPFGLLVSLVLLGVLATFSAMLLEQLGIYLLENLPIYNDVLYNLILYFVIVGIAEEGSKYFLLSKRTWKSPHFNCQFDAVIYSVFVSLGFALWENVGYVLMYGFETALIRAVTAVPGHACFGVFMGVWYGVAKRTENEGDEEGSRKYRRLALLVPILLHGCYDYLATMESEYASLIFVAFVLCMFIAGLIFVRRLSRNDQYI